MGLDIIKRSFWPTALVTNAVMLACLASTLPVHVAANDAVPVSSQVVAGGVMPDEATKTTVLVKLRELCGDTSVVDQIEVGNVMPPPNWSANVQKILLPVIKQVNRGQPNIDDTQISPHGDVGNEAQRQQLTSDMVTTLGQSYTIKNGLHVATVSEQRLLNQTLANRITEFETGSTTLTSKDRAILDEMAAVLPRLNGHRIGIVDHTDNSGSRALSFSLDQARAGTVKNYLIAKGAEQDTLAAMGVGPDQPVVANNTDGGCSRNRRIEFRASKWRRKVRQRRPTQIARPAYFG